jgi:T-complex protein 1 subunit delta
MVYRRFHGILQVVSQYSSLLAPIAVDSVLHVIDPLVATNVDLKAIRVVQKVGGTIDDTELINGLVLSQEVLKNAGGPTRIEKARIGLIQFQLSPPKPDVRSSPEFCVILRGHSIRICSC